MSKKVDDSEKSNIPSNTDSPFLCNVLELISAVTLMPKKVKRKSWEQNRVMLMMQKLDDFVKKKWMICKINIPSDTCSHLPFIGKCFSWFNFFSAFYAVLLFSSFTSNIYRNALQSFRVIKLDASKRNGNQAIQRERTQKHATKVTGFCFYSMKLGKSYRYVRLFLKP